MGTTGAADKAAAVVLAAFLRDEKPLIQLFRFLSDIIYRYIDMIYLYMLVSLLQTSMVPLKGFMLEVWSPLAFVVQGLRKNLFGLGCPFYCTSPSRGALLAAFLLGLVLGVGFLRLAPLQV